MQKKQVHISNFKFKILFFILLVNIFSCKHKNHNDDINKLNDLKSLTLEQEQDDLQRVIIDKFIDSSTIEFIQLETSKETLLDHIGFLKIVDNNIIIQNKKSNQVLRFEKNGKYKGYIGKYGRGPGEFLKIMKVRYDKFNNTINILDESYKLITYDINGHFNKNIDCASLMPLDFEFSNSNEMIFYSGFNGYFNNNTQNYRLIIVNNKMQINKSFLKYKIPNNILNINQPIDYFSSFDNNIHFFEPFNPIIYSYKNKTFNLDYKINYANAHNLSEKALLDYEIALKEIEKSPKDYSELYKIVDSNRYIFLLYFYRGVSLKYSIFDKISKKSSKSGIRFYYDKLNIEIDGLPYINDDGTFLFVLSANKILNSQKELDRQLKNKTFTPLQARFLALKPKLYDNPILMKVKFKD